MVTWFPLALSAFLASTQLCFAETVDSANANRMGTDTGCFLGEPDGAQDIARWAKQIDPLGDAFPRKAENGDYVTRFGTILDRGCFEPGIPKKREDLINYVERALEDAIRATERCANILSFKEIRRGSIAQVLRRTRFVCDPSPNYAYASNQIAKWRWSISLFRPVNTSYDRTYEFTLYPKALNERMVHEYAASFAHEALHSLPANQRDWHNDANGRNFSGCSKSVFEDRIYVIEAACFPNSSNGFLFFDSEKGAVNCKNVCERAFEEVDASTVQDFRKQIGPSLVATSYTEREATQLCAKIRHFAEIRRKFDRAADAALSSLKQLYEIAAEAEKSTTQPNSEELGLLIQLGEIESFVRYTKVLRPDATSLGTFQVRFRKKRDETQRFLREFCEKKSVSDSFRETFCAKNFKNALNKLDLASEALENVEITEELMLY